MQDREVSELWRKAWGVSGPDRDCPGAQDIVELTRKLVEERKRNKSLQRHMEDCGHYTYPTGQRPLDRSVNEEMAALRDFGIPSEDWHETDLLPRT